MPRVARSSSDEELLRRLAAGDPAAAAVLDDRYRKPLQRYARSLLRRSDHDAEDAVQDVFLRAIGEARAGRAPDQLKPWLYRLVRNRAIDEVRRARWGDAALEDDERELHDLRAEPETVVRRRETVRRLVEDLADLPTNQRQALLARELDGATPEQVADQLGVTVGAAQMLATRARQNLVRARDARDADCLDVRAQLLDAHERGVRPSDASLRHVAGCAPCTAYRKDLKRLHKRLGMIAPPLAWLPFAGVAGKFAGGVGGGAAAAGAAALVLAATGGIVVLSSDVDTSGEPAPFELKGIPALVGRAVKTGDRIPPGTAVVTARVKVPAAPPPEGVSRSVTVACPAGMKLAGLQSPEQNLPLSYGIDDRALIGSSSKARIVFGRKRLERDYTATVGVLCRTPNRRGSLTDNPRAQTPGEQLGRVCVDSQYIYQSPGKGFVGTVNRGEPVAIQRRSASGRWVRVAKDTGSEGWLPASTLC